MASSSSPPPSTGEKKHWWLRNRKIVDKYVKEARFLMATQEQSEISSALNLLQAALALSPRFETALELKAKSLLCLRRFKEVADMLQDYIPSLKLCFDDSSSSSSMSSSDGSTSQPLSKERVKLLSSSSAGGDLLVQSSSSIKCFSISDLKKSVMAGLCRNCDKEGQWRYIVLGQAYCHLGLMEDAVLLLQTGNAWPPTPSAARVFAGRMTAFHSHRYLFPLKLPTSRQPHLHNHSKWVLLILPRRLTSLQRRNLPTPGF